MTFLLPALAVAFAAFCVWLTVRIVNRWERWAKWTLVVMVLVAPPASYVGAYLALVQPVPTVPDRTTELYCWPNGNLTHNHAFWRRVFEPAHALDRKARTDIWRD
jgi:ABC-type Fe3+ transport system permease subunit